MVIDSQNVPQSECINVCSLLYLSHISGDSGWCGQDGVVAGCLLCNPINLSSIPGTESKKERINSTELYYCTVVPVQSRTSCIWAHTHARNNNKK